MPTRPHTHHAARRQRFMEQMKEGVAIIPSTIEQLRNGDSHHRFRPDSDFYYLTGFEEPAAVLVLRPQHPEHRTAVFVRPRDPEKEVWNGRRVGVDAAAEQLGVDVAYAIGKLPEMLDSCLLGATRLYYQLGVSEAFDHLVIESVHRLSKAMRRKEPSPREIHDPGVILHELRLRKERSELDLMRQAATISEEAFRKAMASIRPGGTEREVEALLEHVFRAGGGIGPAYPSIVACGENATILHYIENSAPLVDEELLLIDAGVELGYYASDVTRTVPVNGRFSPLQRKVYEIVLAAEKAAIAQIRPGVSVFAPHETAVRILTRGLVALEVLSGDLEQLIADEAYKPYYMHQTGHWLGLDVHDAGDYLLEGEPRLLEPGMITTVEPGLYFGMLQPDVPEELKGIGIRIEDDVLITEEGHEVLTGGIPKEVSELEALIGKPILSN